MDKNLTLLMPLYNKAPYIERCIKSISEQTYLSRTKIIVCDDCSTDNSVEVLKYCANKYHVPMVLYINEKNLGIAGNKPQMYRMIDTEFWTMLDPDDYYIHPERLERGVKFLEEHPDFSVHGCNYYLVNEVENKYLLAFPRDIQFEYYVADNFPTMSFFQTSSATFRNFWTDELLTWLDNAVKNRRYHFSEGDAFRNYVASNYGKSVLDNYMGSVYSENASGSYSTCTELEKNLLGVGGSLNFANLASTFFKNKSDEAHFMQTAMKHYIDAIDDLSNMAKKLSMNTFKAKEYTVQTLQLDSDDINTIFKYLLSHENILNKVVDLRGGGGDS